MTLFVPPGFQSCFEVLSELHAEMYKSTKAIPNHHWHGAFTVRYSNMGFTDLRREDAERLRDTVLALQEELYMGKRTACYPDGASLANMKRELFIHEKATECIARGRVQSGMWSVNPINVPMFIKRKAEATQAHNSNLPQKPGPKAILPKVATAYAARWPNGHRAEGIKFKDAKKLISDDIGEAFSDTTMRSAIHSLG